MRSKAGNTHFGGGGQHLADSSCLKDEVGVGKADEGHYDCRREEGKKLNFLMFLEARALVHHPNWRRNQNTICDDVDWVRSAQI